MGSLLECLNHVGEIVLKNQKIEALLLIKEKNYKLCNISLEVINMKGKKVLYQWLGQGNPKTSERGIHNGSFIQVISGYTRY